MTQTPQQTKTPAFDLETASLTGAYILEAGAGTGKTYSLEHLVLRLIVEENCAIDSILIVTFTKAATGELGERVRTMLERIALCLQTQRKPDDRTEADLLDGWKARGLDTAVAVERALERFDDACIFTIHSFCQKMLSELTFTRGGVFEVDYGADNGALVEQVVEEFIREALPTLSEKAAVKLVGQLIGLKKILSTLSNAGREARRVSVPRPDADTSPKPSKSAKKSKPDPDQDSVAADLEHFLADFAVRAPARLRDLEARAGVSGFDRLLTDMLELCRTNEAFVESVRARFDAVLIDEFQDTDPLQYAVFKRLFLEGEGLPKAVFFVGDPKQAIYSFRGAELSTYLKARNEMLARGSDRVLSLQKNFRSAAPLVSFVNHYFNDEGEARHFLNPALRFETSQAAAKSQPLMLRHAGKLVPVPAVSVWMLTSRDFEEQLAAPAVQTMDAERIARDIEALLTHDVWVRRDTVINGVEYKARRLRPGDITILLRNRTSASNYLNALRSRGIRAALLGSGSVFATEEAVHIRAVLQALVAPDDRRIFNTARATRIWGRTLSEINDAAQKAGVEDKTLLQKARQAWTKGGPSAAFAVLFEGRHTAECILPTVGGEQTLINYAHVLERMQAQFVCLKKAEAMLRWLTNKMQTAGSNEDEADSLRAVTDQDTVCVQTIHSSKGLEYPVVYTALTEESAAKDGTVYCERDKSSDAPCFFAEAAGFKRSGIANAMQEQYEESVRLAYVAMTRASSRLVIPLFYPTNSHHTGQGKWNNGFLMGLLGNKSIFDGTYDGKTLDSSTMKRPAIYSVLQEVLLERFQDIQEKMRRDMTTGDMKDCAEPCAQDFSGGGPVPELDSDWRQTMPLLEIVDSEIDGRIQDFWAQIDAPYRALESQESATAPDEARAPRALLPAWRRSSFTEISRRLGHPGQVTEGDEFENEDELDIVHNAEGGHADAGDLAQTADVTGPSTSAGATDSGDPLAALKGAEFGKWLHKVFETIFRHPDNKDQVIERIADWVNSAPVMDDLTDDGKRAVTERLRSLVEQTLEIPILRAAGVEGPGVGVRLGELDRRACTPEMPFLMSVRQKRLVVEDVVRMMNAHGCPMHAEEAAGLFGYMTGSIDLVFYADGRYWIIDWKSNFLGRGDGASYTQQAMQAAVDDKHYRLQYVIYLLALKRHLKVALQLDDEEVWAQMGGAFYVFFRGIDRNAPIENHCIQGVLFDRPREAVDALDRLLNGQCDGDIKEAL